MLTTELAEEIVRETYERLQRPVNLMDASAVILASSNASRVGTYHAAAAEVIRTNKPFAVSAAEAARLSGTYPGINLPVRYEGAVIGAVGVSGPPQEVEPFGGLVAMTVELLLRQRVLGMREEWRQLMADLAVEEAIRQDREPDAAVIEQRLSALQFPARPPVYAAAIGAPDPGPFQGRERLLHVIRRMLPDGRALLSELGPSRYALLLFGLPDEAAARSLLAALHSRLAAAEVPCRIGMSAAAPDWLRLPLAYREAEEALRLSRTLAVPEGLIHYGAVEAEALIHAVPEPSRQRLLAKLGGAMDGKTRETLEAFFACRLSVAETVRLLGIHRNTLLYRLEQIKRRTGRDPRHFYDAMLLQYALWLTR